MRNHPKLILFGICTILFALMNYGGVRSPDSEIVFRTGESLASRGSFAVPDQLEQWRGFGLAPGRDGRLYSVFGPVQSIASAPVIGAAEWINRTGWYNSSPVPVQPSHWCGDGAIRYLRRAPLADPEPHALRFIVSFLNSVVTALGVVLFWMILRRLGISEAPAWCASILYASGTLAWPYAGTFFSEPLGTLFVLGSFYLLVSNHPSVAGASASPSGLFWAGCLLALATGTHITAALFVPFFVALAAHACLSGDRRSMPRLIVSLLLGLMMPIACMAYYNYARFGSPLETGRTVNPADIAILGYGKFVAPWIGLYGLLFSAGKGMLLFCPAVMMGIFCWPRLHRRYSFISVTLAGALVFRLVFVASRSDWPGGICLGPRYLLMAVPFLMIPAAFWLEEELEKRSWKRLGAFSLLGLACIAQQLYFCIGEAFSYYLVVFMMAERHGVLFAHDYDPYLMWRFSPLTQLLDGRRGPFILQNVPLSNLAIWAISSVVAAAVLAIVLFRFVKRVREEDLEVFIRRAA